MVKSSSGYRARCWWELKEIRTCTSRFCVRRLGREGEFEGQPPFLDEGFLYCSDQQYSPHPSPLVLLSLIAFLFQSPSLPRLPSLSYRHPCQTYTLHSHVSGGEGLSAAGYSICSTWSETQARLWLARFYSSLHLSPSLPRHPSIYPHVHSPRPSTPLSPSLAARLPISSARFSLSLPLSLRRVWHWFQGCCAVDCCYAVKYCRQRFSGCVPRGVEARELCSVAATATTADKQAGEQTGWTHTHTQREEVLQCWHLLSHLLHPLSRSTSFCAFDWLAVAVTDWQQAWVWVSVSQFGGRITASFLWRGPTAHRIIFIYEFIFCQSQENFWHRPSVSNMNNSVKPCKYLKNLWESLIADRPGIIVLLTNNKIRLYYPDLWLLFAAVLLLSGIKNDVGKWSMFTSAVQN